ncbi:MAG: hypothetical protein FWF45_06520 [Coriobacteriia bacterium]|nr:hypothetical protein [Coriobacteriia bacterium]
MKYHLRFMAAYIIVVYVPFAVALMLSGQNVGQVSLSRIAWQHGGMTWMILFGLLTLPFMLYLVYYYVRADRRRAKTILVTILLVAGVILFMGMFLPDRGSDLLAHLHFYFEDNASLVVMLAITGMVAHYCATGGSDQRTQRISLGVGYGLFAAAACSVYLMRVTCAAFEVGLSLGAMVTLCLINRWISLSPRGDR